jgi:hypothetical protein
VPAGGPFCPGRPSARPHEPPPRPPSGSSSPDALVIGVVLTFTSVHLAANFRSYDILLYPTHCEALGSQAHWQSANRAMFAHYAHGAARYAVAVGIGAGCSAEF